MDPAPPLRAAVYLRVSTQEQEKGYSLEGQLRDCRAYCERQGYHVSRILQDVDSGRNLEHPSFQRLLDLAVRQKFEVVVVWRRDRFGRDAVGNGFFERIRRQAGVRIETAQQGPKDASPYTDFLDRIMDAVDELEAKRIAERCHLGRVTAVQNGIWPSKAPYGYRKNAQTQQLEEDPQTAPVVRVAYKQYLAGQPGHVVARIFGTTLQAAMNRLHNPVYYGKGLYVRIDIETLALVSEDELKAVQTMVAERRSHAAQPVKPYAKREAGYVTNIRPVPNPRKFRRWPVPADQRSPAPPVEPPGEALGWPADEARRFG